MFEFFGRRKGGQWNRILSAVPPGSALRPIIDTPKFQDLGRTYEATNAEALRMQSRYRRLRMGQLVLVTVAAVVGGISVFPITESLPFGIKSHLGAVWSAANFGSVGLIWLLNKYGPDDVWMRTRVQAERQRVGLFQALLDARMTGNDEPAGLLTEKLDVIESALLRYQMGFFASKIRDARSSHRHFRVWKAIATVATVCSFCISMMAWFGVGDSVLPGVVGALGLIRHAFDWRLGLSLVSSGLLAYVSARLAMDQSDRNAQLYSGTLNRLTDLEAAEGNSVRDAAARNDQASVQGYLNSIKAILEDDLGVWKGTFENSDAPAMSK